MAMRLGAKMPDFKCVTTKGTYSFHEFCDSDPERPWTILFTHPKDFTPVCTTELGQCHILAPEFSAMGCKLIGISCDTVEEHHEWTKDVLARAKKEGDGELAFPIVADEKRDIVTELGMLDPAEKDAAGLPLPARALIIVGPDKTVKLAILYPATCGRNFEEVKRVVRSLHLTASLKLATPVNWKEGERLIVAPSCTTEEAQEKFQNFSIEELPSKKPYLRSVDCPK
jgi:1-Cys peroxiredoxin 6